MNHQRVSYQTKGMNYHELDSKTFLSLTETGSLVDITMPFGVSKGDTLVRATKRATGSQIYTHLDQESVKQLKERTGLEGRT